MSTEPEALRLAEVLENIAPSYLHDEELDTAAWWLRKQHAEIERLRNDLRNIQFAAELVRDYAVQLYDDCVEALKEDKR